MNDIYVLIVAAGRGQRLHGDIPKQYLQLAGKAVLRHTVLAFLQIFKPQQIRVIIREKDRDLYNDSVSDLGLLDPVIGGQERPDSVRNGLASLRVLNPRQVLIHDAVRPFISTIVINRVIEQLQTSPAVLPVIYINDTAKKLRSDESIIEETLDRSRIALAQTPQGFAFALIDAAHNKVQLEFITDDCQLVESTTPVTVVLGDELNFKITTIQDLAKAEGIMTKEIRYETRIGMGFDAHRFNEHQGASRYIMLCGFAVPCDVGLEAHSDGDVAIHALVDAILGAIGEGDIGMHFPPADMKWKDAPSHQFLTHALELVREKGAKLVNVDITLIGEKPRIGKYREQMRERLAEILDIAVERVNIKATTTEKMGFTGREEGIAAQAVASVEFVKVE